MNKAHELESRKSEIAAFLRQLPDGPITISGKHMTNELFINGKKISLKKSLKVRSHSPSGYNWGYSGSGPAQTSLAILLEFTDKGTASWFYQDLKFGWVAGLPQSDF